MSPSIEEIKEVLKIFLDSEMQDLRLEIGDVRLAVSKSGGAPQPFTAPPPAAAAAATTTAAARAAAAPAAVPIKAAAAPKAIAEVPEGWVAVTAPSVGVFYRRPAPDQPPFVEVGSKVSANDPVCLIEVMKMFTSVPAPSRGRIAEILVEDASMVEYGQALMYIEPV